MNWLGLFNKIGKQPIKNTQNQKVYALIRNEKTGEYEKKYLALKFDAKTKPYLVEDIELTKKMKEGKN